MLPMKSKYKVAEYPEQIEHGLEWVVSSNGFTCNK